MIAFRRVIIVVLENASRDTVLTNQYMRDLRQKGVFLSNSHCITHPSQPNYFTMVAGDTLGVVNDNDSWVYWTQTTAPLTPDSCLYPDVTSIIDLLEAQRLSWKAYAENFDSEYVSTCPQGSPNYIKPSSAPDNSTPLNQQPPLSDNPIQSYPDAGFARRHVPFLSFPNIVNNPERVKKIVDATEFETDLQNGTLPHYSFYTPNLINDGHSLPSLNAPQTPADNYTADDHPPADPIVDKDQLINVAKFLQSFLGDDPVSKFPPETLIVITFDESYGAGVPYNIYTLLIGDMLKAGTVCHESYNHYSLLRTIEDNFGLGTLGRNDAAATPYWFVRREAYR